jgi:hypothetical protein
VHHDGDVSYGGPKLTSKPSAMTVNRPASRGIVDHGGSGTDREQDVGGPSRGDVIGQALDQWVLVTQCPARSCRVTIEVALTVLTSLR